MSAGKKRLKRALKDYGKGVVFKSAFTGFIFESLGNPKLFQMHRKTLSDDIVDESGGVIYDSKKEKWAEIIGLV